MAFASPHALEEFINSRMNALVQERLARSWRIQRDLALDRLYLDVVLYETQHCRYVLNGDELAMGGVESVVSFMDTVHRDLAHRQRWWGTVGTAGTPAPDMTATEMQQRWQEYNGRYDAHLRYMLDMLESARAWLDPQSEEKNQRARELFVSVAGARAATELDAGHGVSVKGSSGTAYLLYKKASYCITRVSDGVQFCAVVPGVPLWDHLLGVKLMLEHDEPRFLRTANKAGGHSLNNDVYGREMLRQYARQAYLTANPPLIMDPQQIGGLIG